MRKKFGKICLLACVALFSVACNPVVRHYIWAKAFPPSVVEIGEHMVDAKLLDMDGNKRHLSDYMSNKYMLLIFGGGCGYFMASLPEMREVSEINHEYLTLIIIYLDVKNRWKEAVVEHNMPGINLYDPKTVRGLAYKYSGSFDIPYYVIISPEGKIVDKWFGYRTGLLKQKVAENMSLQ